MRTGDWRAEHGIPNAESRGLLVTQKDGTLFRVYDVCALSTCPGGRGVGAWRGTVTCDPAVHAEHRVHAAGYCVCGHKAHGKHRCQWCNFLGELCRETRLCDAEPYDGLKVRVRRVE